MFKKIQIDMKRVFPALVVSTMSSGKSTLINALAGIELLPSKNSACTAKAIAVLDNDNKKDFGIHMVDKYGQYKFLRYDSESILTKFNQTDDISEMIIEGDFSEIRNYKKSLMLIDTPGINNSLDLSHTMATNEILDEYSECLILYLINAQQIGTYDDSNFLATVAEKIKKNPEFNILFVVNKMDLIDPEKEKPDELIESCKKYIQSKGIENPTIIPVSAISSLIFKKVLNNIPLSEFEEENFRRYYSYFKRSGFSLSDYAIMTERGSGQEILTVDGESYSKADVFAALNNTGIPLLEKVIDKSMVRSLKIRPPKITVASSGGIYNNKKSGTRPKKKT